MIKFQRRRVHQFVASLIALVSIGAFTTAAAPVARATIDDDLVCGPQIWNGSIGYKNCAAKGYFGHWWSGMYIENDRGISEWVDSQFYYTIDNGAPNYSSIWRNYTAVVSNQGNVTAVDPYNQLQQQLGLNHCTPKHKYHTFVRVRIGSYGGGGSWGDWAPSPGWTCLA